MFVKDNIHIIYDSEKNNDMLPNGTEVVIMEERDCGLVRICKKDEYNERFNRSYEVRLDQINKEVIGKMEEHKMDQQISMEELIKQLKMPTADEIAEEVLKKQKKSKRSQAEDTLFEQMCKSMTDVFAAQKADDLLESIYPKIDERIKNVYGFLPQVHEIKIGKEVHKITGVTHEKFDEILTVVNSHLPVYLVGPAGTGKNVICKQVAESLGLPFYFTNAVTQEYKLTGFIDANGTYQKTQFYDAFTNGGLFFLDEMDGSIPEVLIILNAAIANGYFDFPIGKIEAHPDFYVIAAGNTIGTGADANYTGRYSLDRASLDRFVTIKVDYSDKIMKAMADEKQELLEFVKSFNKVTDKAGIDCLFSYRSIERINRLEEVLDDLGEVLQISLLKGLNMDDINNIKNYYQRENDSIKNNKYVNTIMNYKFERMC